MGRSVGRPLKTARCRSPRPQKPFESVSVTISSMDSGSIQLAMSESMSDESMIGSGGDTLEGRQRLAARDLIVPADHDPQQERQIQKVEAMLMIYLLSLSLAV